MPQWRPFSSIATLLIPDVEYVALQLKASLSEILAQPGARKPDRVKFFRNQMQTIISRALTELEIKPVPSRRCFSLLGAELQAA